MTNSSHEASHDEAIDTTPPSIDELKVRVEALEVGRTFRATQTEVAQVEAEMLVRLRDIRTALIAANGGNGASAERGASASSSKEVEALRSENAELRKKTAKLQYRVEHLVREVEQMYRHLHEESSSKRGEEGERDDSRAEF